MQIYCISLRVPRGNVFCFSQAFKNLAVITIMNMNILITSTVLLILEVKAIHTNIFIHTWNSHERENDYIGQIKKNRFDCCFLLLLVFFFFFNLLS